MADEFAAGIFCVFGGVDGEQMIFEPAFHFGSGVRDELEGKPVVVECDFVTGDVFLVDVAFDDQRAITTEPGEICFAHQHAKKFGTRLDPLREIKFRALREFGFEDQFRIHADKVLAVEFAVIVAFAGKMFFVIGGVVVAVEEVEFEMDVRAFFGDAFAGVAGAAHGSDLFAGVDLLADFQAVANRAEMGV